MTDIARKLAYLVGILFVALTLGCASTATKEGTGEYVDDTVITTKVKAAIFNEPAQLFKNALAHHGDHTKDDQ